MIDLNDNSEYVSHILQQSLLHFDFVRAVWEYEENDLTLYTDSGEPFSISEFKPDSFTYYVLENIIGSLRKHCHKTIEVVAMAAVKGVASLAADQERTPSWICEECGERINDASKQIWTIAGKRAHKRRFLRDDGRWEINICGPVVARRGV